MATLEDDRRDGKSAQGHPSAPAPDGARAAKLTAALILFALAGGLVFASRAEWAELVCGPSSSAQGRAPSPPDFDLGRTTIPRDEIHGGGPPKDGIPALTHPATLAAADATYLEAGDRVAGVALGGRARAYPLRILTWHEVVNDTLGGVPVAVTYCPLCDSVAAFDRRVGGEVKEFGVSGLLYNSNVLLYDRGGKPEALWSQLKGESVSGPRAGTRLTALPVEVTTWSAWKGRHPTTTVLAAETGHPRDYRHDPYEGYFSRAELMFPVRPTNEDRPAKERVLGVWVPGGPARAYPLSAFERAGGPVEVRDEVGGKKLVIRYEPTSRSLGVVEAEDGLRWMYSFWFAWYAFHPETSVHAGG